MALNPFFLQGSPSEQRLVQSLINEQLKIYGVEVVYIPRKFVRKETIIREVTTSKFDDNFAIEAYVNNYEGYSGQGDILTKFGMNLKDELNLIISKERFEDFISPFITNDEQAASEISTRPREGDIIYFPLGQRIFEVKFVEHEQPFYQLGKTYVYELKCELFQYEDEMGGWSNINTSEEEIDTLLENVGYITKLQLISVGTQALATATVDSGYIRKIVILNDGYDYTSTPTVSISTAPSGGKNAQAVAITTSINGVHSIKEILLVNAGAGYTVSPGIAITGGGGSGVAITCVLVTGYSGISSVSIASTALGSGYPTSPTISFSSPTAGLAVTAVGRVSIAETGIVTGVLLSDAGIGYTTTPTATISPPPLITGIGTFVFNEVVNGSISGASGRVKTWNSVTNVLKVGTTDGTFVPGDIIVGETSNATYSLDYVEESKFSDKYEDNDQIEEEADLIVDFSESNPFGNY
jgi:hypothetical protein